MLELEPKVFPFPGVESMRQKDWKETPNSHQASSGAKASRWPRSKWRSALRPASHCGLTTKDWVGRTQHLQIHSQVPDHTAGRMSTRLVPHADRLNGSLCLIVNMWDLYGPQKGCQGTASCNVQPDRQQRCASFQHASVIALDVPS